MRAVRITAFVLAVAVGLVTQASPAAAHGKSGGELAPATNYRTRILSVEPRIEGVKIRVIEAGSRIEVHNTTDREVVVLGYENEPYLRVGPDGVFENLRSKSTYINASRDGDTSVPPEADANAEPDWAREESSPRARWHDHRAHWMGRQDPPQVRRDPSREHVIVPRWELTILDGDRRIVVVGDLTWVPGPSPAPWLAIAAVAALLTVVLAMVRRLWRGVLPAAASLVGAAGVVHLVAAAMAGTTTGATALGQLIPLLPLAAAAATIGLVVRNRTPDGFFAAAAAGLLSMLVFGLSNVGYLSRSQLPVRVDAGLVRGAVALSLGLGVGLFLAGILRWRAEPSPGTGPAVE